jgi:lipoprotein-anchoring transpeptidase ErfK/SrfK
MFGGLVATGVGVLAAGTLLLLIFAISPTRVAAGVTVAGAPIGGLDERAAAAAIAQAAASPVTLADGDRRFPVAPAELGVAYDQAAMLAAAFDAAPNSAVAPRLSVDLAQTQAGLVALGDAINIPPQTSPAQAGWVMEIPVMLDRLYRDPAGELADGLFELNMMAVEPPEPERGANYTGEPSEHVVERGQELGLIARAYNVSVNDIVTFNDLGNPDLIYVGQVLRIPAPGLYTPTAADAPPAPTAAGRAIVVSTGDQRIYAYENGQLVRSHLVSTGRAETPTVLGDYNIYVKYVADDMSGPDYFLPQVPYTMYFYQGYAIHGTYWHNSFGRPMSHGCVNLPADESAWWFSFADVGTLVRVI